MKLFIVRDSSSVGARFKLYDGNEPVLDVVSKPVAAGERLKAVDKSGKCAFKITSMPVVGSIVAYNVATGKSSFGVVIKKSKGELCVKIHGAGYFLCGTVNNHTFSICNVSKDVIASHAPTPGKVSSYSLEVSEPALFADMAAICICVDLLGFSDSAVACRA